MQIQNVGLCHSVAIIPLSVKRQAITVPSVSVLKRPALLFHYGNQTDTEPSHSREHI